MFRHEIESFCDIGHFLEGKTWILYVSGDLCPSQYLTELDKAQSVSQIGSKICHAHAYGFQVVVDPCQKRLFQTNQVSLNRTENRSFGVLHCSCRTWFCTDNQSLVVAQVISAMLTVEDNKEDWKWHKKIENESVGQLWREKKKSGPYRYRSGYLFHAKETCYHLHQGPLRLEKFVEFSIMYLLVSARFARFAPFLLFASNPWIYVLNVQF